MQYLNSCMNPIACFIECKSARDDLKHFVRFVAHKVRCTCRKSAFERTDEHPDNMELTQVVSVNTNNMLNVAPTPV